MPRRCCRTAVFAPAALRTWSASRWGQRATPSSTTHLQWSGHISSRHELHCSVGNNGSVRSNRMRRSPLSVVCSPRTPSQRSFRIGWSMMPSTGSPSRSSAIRVPYSGLPAAAHRLGIRQSSRPGRDVELIESAHTPTHISSLTLTAIPSSASDRAPVLSFHCAPGWRPPVPCIQRGARGRARGTVAPVMKLLVPSMGSSTQR